MPVNVTKLEVSTLKNVPFVEVSKNVLNLIFGSASASAAPGTASLDVNKTYIFQRTDLKFCHKIMHILRIR